MSQQQDDNPEDEQVTWATRVMELLAIVTAWTWAGALGFGLVVVALVLILLFQEAATTWILAPAILGQLFLIYSTFSVVRTLLRLRKPTPLMRAVIQLQSIGSIELRREIIAMYQEPTT